MSLREQLNHEHHRQALHFADSLTEAAQAEFIQETEARKRFEQAHILQNFGVKRPLAKLGLLTLGLILVLATVIYWQMGRYQAVTQGEQMFSQFQQQRTEQQSEDRNQHYILSLQNRLRENPNDGDLWFELAQAYALNNEFENAMICYQNAQTVQGKTAAILGGMATVEYYRGRHQLTPQIKSWIEEALSKDPNESASRLLLASDAFLRNDFREAISHWEAVLNSENSAVDRREVIRSIQSAKARLGQ